MKKYILGNCLRGGFSGQFNSVEDAWLKLGSKFLSVNPCQKFCSESNAMVLNPESARSVILMVENLNEFGFIDKRTCKKGDFNMSECIDVEKIEFEEVLAINF